MSDRIVSMGDCLMAFVDYDGIWRRDFAGAEMNFLIGCSRLGLNTGLITSLSNDSFGEEIYQLLTKEGIDTSRINRTDDQTGLIFRQLKDGLSTIIGYYRQGTAGSCLQSSQLDHSYLADAKHFHFTGIFPMLSEDNHRTLERALELARRYDLTTSFDVNIRWQLFDDKQQAHQLASYLDNCDMFLGGIKEAQFLLKTRDRKRLIDRLKELGVKHIVLKMGAEGCFAHADGESLFQPTTEVRDGDPTGAGDAFNAGYIYACLQQWQLKDRLSFASFVGSRVAASSSDNQDFPYAEDALRDWQQLRC